MMDQQNFEAARPASADPSVALAEALGQLPRERPKAPPVKPALAASVETLAREMGLKLGDQNQLTIRRIKRGKSYSFVRANGTPIRLWRSPRRSDNGRKNPISPPRAMGTVRSRNSPGNWV